MIEWPKVIMWHMTLERMFVQNSVLPLILRDFDAKCFKIAWLCVLTDDFVRCACAPLKKRVGDVRLKLNLFRRLWLWCWHSLLDFHSAAQTINTIKKCSSCAHKTNNTNEIIISNNTTKQPDDIDQLVTSYSCDILQTAPPSQMHTI